MLIPETLLLEIVQDAFSQFREDPSVLEAIFGENLKAQEVSKIQAFIADHTRPVQIVLGFPQSPIQGPIVALTLGVSEESDQFLGLGERHYLDSETTPGAPQLVQQEEALFQNTWRFTVYSHNALMCLYIAYIVRYVLFAQRGFIQEAGLVEQRISMGDFEPTPEYLPDLIYMRAVMLSAKSEETFALAVPVGPITSVTVNAG